MAKSGVETRVDGLLRSYEKEDYSRPKLMAQRVDDLPEGDLKAQAQLARAILDEVDALCKAREREILDTCKAHPGFSTADAIRNVRKLAARSHGTLEEILVRRELAGEFRRAGEDTYVQSEVYKRLKEQLDHLKMARDARERRIDMDPLDGLTAFVFYSWQARLPNRTNRGLIQSAIERACKTIERDDVQPDLVVDRDTTAVPGSPDITETILRKIDRSSAFVADVSIMPESRTPNPNVLIELGYALKIHDWDGLIMVMNTAYGGPEQLPFNLRGKRVLKYSLAEDGDTGPARRDIEKQLEAALRIIVASD